jgi:hypothetical protein
LGAAGSLTLNGPNITFAHNNRQITLTSANNLSAVNFTITGTDIYGNAQSEVLAGPNANTVASVNSYSSVTSIATNGAVAQVSAGLGTSGIAGTYLYDHFSIACDLGVQAIVTGTINYTLTYSFNDAPDIYDVGFTPVVAMTAATTSQMANVIQPTRYVYMVINSSNVGGGLVTTLIQQGLQ